METLQHAMMEEEAMAELHAMKEALLEEAMAEEAERQLYMEQVYLYICGAQRLQ
jgi:hypothetical protein